MRTWTSFDAIEALVHGALLALAMFSDVVDRYPNIAGAFTLGFALIPIFGGLIMKRIMYGVIEAQGRHIAGWVTNTAVQVCKLLAFNLLLLLGYVICSTAYPYDLDTSALNQWLREGNHSSLRCDNEAVFWATFELPYTVRVGVDRTIACEEPLCGYRDWTALCQAVRNVGVHFTSSNAMMGTVACSLFLAIIFFVLRGSDRISHNRDGSLILGRLLDTHILVILGCSGVLFVLTMLNLVRLMVTTPLLLFAAMPGFEAEPLALLGAAKWNNIVYVVALPGPLIFGAVAIALLPVDTLATFMKRRHGRKKSYFLSYRQNDGNDGAVQMLHAILLRERGVKSVWLDKLAEDRSETGMINGVKESDVFVAVISPTYFASKFCCLEVHTALKEGKKIVAVWNLSKEKVQSALKWIPDQLKFLKTNELLPIQEDVQMAATCAARIHAKELAPFDLTGDAYSEAVEFLELNEFKASHFRRTAAAEEARRAAMGAIKETLATVERALNGDAKSWGAVPSASTPCRPPSEWSAAAPLAKLLKDLQADQASLATVFREVQQLAKQMFAKVVPLIAASEEAQRLLLDTFEKRKRGSLEQYRTILTRTKRDATFPDFLNVSQGLREKLNARGGECVQEKPSSGDTLDFATLRSQAGQLKLSFDKFVEDVATKCGAKHSTPPLKGAWRAIEKMALRTESAGVKCGALMEGPLDATPLCDVLRGSLQCKDFTMLVTALDLLKALDSEFGDLEHARGMTQRIRLLRIKDRFTAPTSGGWADVLVNFVFEDNYATTQNYAAKHVVELQLQHESLLLVRKEGGGHKDYNEFRSAFELLEAVGKAPTDAFENATDAGTDVVVAGPHLVSLNRELRSLRELLGEQQAKIEAMVSLECRLKTLEDNTVSGVGEGS